MIFFEFALPSRDGVNKAPFFDFSIVEIFNFAKINVRLFESLSYLTGVAEAELRRHDIQ